MFWLKSVQFAAPSYIWAFERFTKDLSKNLSTEIVESIPTIEHSP